MEVLPVRRASLPLCGSGLDGVVRLPGYWRQGSTHLARCPSGDDTRSADSLDKTAPEEIFISNGALQDDLSRCGVKCMFKESLY